LLLAGGGPFRHDQYLHLITIIGMAGNSAAAAEHFVVGVGGDNQHIPGNSASHQFKRRKPL
jgi:hypothetical protein